MKKIAPVTAAVMATGAHAIPVVAGFVAKGLGPAFSVAKEGVKKAAGKISDAADQTVVRIQSTKHGEKMVEFGKGAEGYLNPNAPNAPTSPSWSGLAGAATARLIGDIKRRNEKKRK